MQGGAKYTGTEPYGSYMVSIQYVHNFVCLFTL